MSSNYPINESRETSLFHEKLNVLMGRQLELEEQLIARLTRVNEKTEKVCNASAFRGPSLQDLDELRPLSDQMQAVGERVREGRQALVHWVCQEDQGNLVSSWSGLLTMYRRALHADTTMRLKDIESQIREAWNAFLRNQVALHYSFDFQRRYLTDVFGLQTEKNAYRIDGAHQPTPSGNLLGKTC